MPDSTSCLERLKGSAAPLLLSLAAGLLPSLAQAMPVPPQDPSWTTLSLRVDARNVTGPGDAGHLSDADLRSRVEAANEVWSQCAVRFVPRSVGNVSAQGLGVSYEPKSQDDLSRLASALNPQGFARVDAIPLTVAGPWRFYDAGTGLFLTGLGWVFTNPQGAIDRIGAMIDAQRIHQPVAGLLIAHELAHALSLPHVAEKDNLMGPGGTSRLTPEQCRQARDFSSSALTPYQLRTVLRPRA